VTGGSRLPAVGGERDVPAPDPIAVAYLELALRLDQRIPGLVDGYYGPAEVKARVDTEQLRSPGRLVSDATELAARLEAEVTDPTRRDWLRRQAAALETHARRLAGETFGYVDEVTRLFGVGPRARGEAVFAAAVAELGERLPGTGDVRERLAVWDARWIIPPDRVAEVEEWLVGALRSRAESVFGLPAGEAVRLSLVTGQPWSGYNWYDGGLRSRVDLNVDLPIRGPDLVATLAHETYAGHHLEHAWKEAELVERLGQLEASAMLINAPECLISEGLAEIGRRLILDPAGEADLLGELADRAGLPDTHDPAAAREMADRAVGIGPVRAALRAVDVDAALMLHVDGRARDEVAAWLERVALLPPDRAARKLEFIAHPLWRTYAFVYADGAELLSGWLAAVPEPDRPARFRRLLVEPISLSTILRESSVLVDPGAGS
jgi:hypothetical protein